MPLAHRSRSRLLPRDIRPFLTAPRTITPEVMLVNQVSHDALHPPTPLIYSSKGTLNTDVGSPIYLPLAGQLVAVRLNVKTAPSSTLTCDILLNGSSVFSGSSKPTIAASSRFGYLALSDKVHFAVDSYLEAQLTATGSAGGPLTVTYLVKWEL
jgi:hypothetical protein